MPAGRDGGGEGWWAGNGGLAPTEHVGEVREALPYGVLAHPVRKMPRQHELHRLGLAGLMKKEKKRQT